MTRFHNITMAFALALAMAGCSREDRAPAAAAVPAPRAAAHFVDEASCKSCHAAEFALWQGSHHALAMQVPDKATVLGDFRGTTFTSHGLATTFSQRDGAFMVRTDGADGKPADFAVKYAFGVSPLQQYLIELPGGRLQALSVAWDTQRKRWFHLYPTERIDHRDELHWTKPSQNWNFMCAECHSTEVRKNYDAAKDTYDTRFFQVNVGCQACHGPGSRHVDWVKANPGAKGAGAHDAGFDVDLKAANDAVQLDSCGRCHSRRSVISPDYAYGRPLMDTHLPALLTEGLYHADGQIQSEDYEYGSFLQSRMGRKGVRCSDCHEPHGAALRAPADSLCMTCHNAQAPRARAGIDTSGLQKEDYQSPEHHFHAPGGPGSHCIECHAPRTTYMVVDPRIDHSFRIPRPDLTVAIGTPNACNGCHRDRTAQWAAAEIEKHHPSYRPAHHYGEALDAGRRGSPSAVSALVALFKDKSEAAIVRATALELLARYPGSADDLRSDAVRDPDPMVRRAAIATLDSATPEQQRYWLAPMLRDDVRAVRIEAAHSLVRTGLPPGDPSSAAFDAALAELEASYHENEDRTEGRAALGSLYFMRGRVPEAEAAYRAAIGFEPVPVAAAVNLADLYRATGREPEAEELLRKTLAAHPGNAAVVHALALALVRQGRKPEALKLLAPVAATDAGDAYLYALALDDSGKHADAMRVLEQALPRSNGNRDILLALASFHHNAGEDAKAAEYLRKLAAINPRDPALRSH